MIKKASLLHSGRLCCGDVATRSRIAVAALLAWLCCAIGAAQPRLDMTGAVTDGSAYYRLFCAAEAIDFSQSEGVDAYVVTRKRLAWGGAQSITLTRVDRVPALTGVLVRTAEAREYNLATATADVEAPAKNALIAVSQPTDVADLFVLNAENPIVVDQYPACLAVAADGSVGFSKVEVSQKAQRGDDGLYRIVFGRDELVLPAGTAYMPINGEAGEMVASGDVVPLVLLDEPELVATADNIQAAKDFVAAAEDFEDLRVTFHDAVVTAVSAGTDGQDAIIVEDKTAAMRLFRIGLADRLKPGDVLNGTLQLYVDYSAYGSALVAGDLTEQTFAQLTVTPGEATPLTVGDDNIEDYIYDYDWRLVRFTGNNHFQNTSADEDAYIYLDILGDRVPVFDILLTDLPRPDDGQQFEVVGFLFNILDGFYLQPLQYIVDGQSTAVRSIPAAPSIATTTKPAYDLQGRRIAAPHSSLVIVDGRKLLLKN